MRIAYEQETFDFAEKVEGQERAVKSGFFGKAGLLEADESQACEKCRVGCPFAARLL